MSRFRQRDRKELTHSRLILCEGAHDAAFFRALIEARNLPSSDVWSSQDVMKDQGKSATGKDAFGECLKGIRSLEGFLSLTEVIIATDSDNDPQASFAQTAAMIAGVPETTAPDEPHKYVVPNAPQSKEAGLPSMAVLMVPWANKRGALETLCFEAASRHCPEHVPHVDAFAAVTGANGWKAQKVGKMRLRTLIAGTYEKRPDISLGHVWNQEPRLIPINDPCFDQIAEFLRSL